MMSARNIACRESGPVAVVIAAAGMGVRMGGDVRKPYLELDGKPILFHTLEKFRSIQEITQRILAVHPEDQGKIKHLWGEILFNQYRITSIVQGGGTRTDTVRNALMALEPEKNQVVLIHDGVRPFVERDVIRSVISNARLNGAAIAAVPATATVKKVDAGGIITSTLDRGGIWLAQTPQGFRRELILRAYEEAQRDGFSATDDAAMVEHLGEKVAVVTDRSDNIKITTPEDLVLAEAILAFHNGRAESNAETQTPEGNAMVRFGLGYDIHKLVEGRALILGGVRIPSDFGLEGHSDADALYHAVADAMLGALALGDIGKFYPDTDPRWKDADSGVILAEVASLVREHGYGALQLDSNILAQRPRLAPYIDDMRANIAELLSIPIDRVSVKARTGEGLDAVGRGEAIAVQAIVSLRRTEGSVA